MVTGKTFVRNTSNAYDIFILILSIFSLIIMVALLLPLADPTIQLLQIYDNLICIFFLVDFFLNLKAASNKKDYFIKARGWLDLLGSMPSLGFFKYTSLLRLARLSRVFRILRQLKEKNKPLVRDVLDNRSQYTGFITILTAILVLTIASVLVLQFESYSPNANIKSGWDSFWFSIVTITTVGYGDEYPVTYGGRLTAMFIMVTGVGIIGALASILSSFLLGSSRATNDTNEEEAPAGPTEAALEQELTQIKEELVVLHQMLEDLGAKIPEK